MLDFPATPTLNQQFSSGTSTWQWDGVAWNVVPQMTPATASDTPPANPAIGQLWWRGSNGKLYIYVDDGNSKQWVETGSNSVLAGGPVTTVLTASSGNYVKPANLVALEVWPVGGGGAGARAGVTGANQASAGGGGGGGTCMKMYKASDLAASEPYLIGGPGLGGVGAPTSGGNTTFKGLTAGGGGSGGALMAALSTLAGSQFGIGGTATGGDLNIPGESGIHGMANIVVNGALSSSGSGGGTFFAQRQPSYYNTGSNFQGRAGNFPGGGSSGGVSGPGMSTAIPSFDAAAGCIIIKEYF